MAPSSALLDLVSVGASPSFLLAVARESLASIETEIALQIGNEGDVDDADEGGSGIQEWFSNVTLRTKKKCSGGGKGGSSSAKGAGKENSNPLAKKDVECELTNLVEKKGKTGSITEKEDGKESFRNALEKNYTIPELETQKEVFVQDIQWLQEMIRNSERPASRTSDSSDSPDSSDIDTPTPRSGRRGRRMQQSHVVTRERTRSRVGIAL